MWTKFACQGLHPRSRDLTPIATVVTPQGGDAANAVHAAAGYNYRRLLAWVALLLPAFLAPLIAQTDQKNRPDDFQAPDWRGLQRLHHNRPGYRAANEIASPQPTSQRRSNWSGEAGVNRKQFPTDTAGQIACKKKRCLGDLVGSCQTRKRVVGNKCC